MDKVLQVLIASTPVVVGDGTATTALPEVASESNPVSFKGGESTLSFTGAVVTIAPKDEGGSASPLPSVTPDVRAADVMWIDVSLLNACRAMDVAAGSKDKQSSQTSGASGSVCAACKAIRSKCDRNRPCARCIYRGKADECVREVASGQCTSADDVLVVALDKVLSARADCRGELAGGKRKRTGARTLQEVLRDAAAAVREARNRASASRTRTDACNAPAACSPSISECIASASLREALLASRGLLCVELHTDEEGHDHDARVVALGRGAQEFFGDTPWGDLRGQAMQYLVHPADQNTFQSMCQRAVAAAAVGGDVPPGSCADLC